ncbi:hypothetical protein ACFL6D_04475, partial [Spirochaetota bacterium]
AGAEKSDYSDMESLLGDDDAGFEETSVVEASNMINKNIAEDIEEESVSLSGDLYMRSTYTMTRDFFERKKNSFEGNSLLTYLDGSLFLDVRLRKNIKAFCNLNLFYSPTGQATYTYYTDKLTGTPLVLEETNRTAIIFKELFLDANIAHRVYFRMGKQVLQWGRGYFWNPSDLINIENKDFLNLDRAREGTYGVKTHIPFGTAFNIYSFLDAKNAGNLDEFALAGKLEALIISTELSLSAWAKKGYFPSYACDLSSRIPLVNVDIYGEARVSYGDNAYKLRRETNTITNYVQYKTFEEWIPRISIGLSKSFDLFDINDRIMVSGEFFYNHNGYDENIFDDKAFVASLAASGRYKMNRHSKYYASIFTSISKFILSDMTLSCNAIGNLSDSSFILTGGLSYSPVYNFALGLSFISYLGKDEREYTYAGNSLGIEINSSITF